MGRKSKYTVEQKIEAVLDYKSGKRSATQISKDLGLYKDGKSIRKWESIYDTYGEVGFLYKEQNKSYSKEFKVMVVKEYLDGMGSFEELTLKYNILSHQTLRKWFLDYNSHIKLKDYNPQGDVYMTKSRKTTLQERIEIVTYCIEHNKQYKLAAKQFDVSYTQVYQWTQKYLKDGEDGLLDKRGQHKTEEEVDELELLRRKVVRLEKQLEDKETETQLLKKVQVVERRRYSPKGNKK